MLLEFLLCSGSESDAGISPQELEASTSEQEQEQGAILVGTVELSFAASSRTRYLTLNAPVVRSLLPVGSVRQFGLARGDSDWNFVAQQLRKTVPMPRTKNTEGTLCACQALHHQDAQASAPLVLDNVMVMLFSMTAAVGVE